MIRSPNQYLSKLEEKKKLPDNIKTTRQFIVNLIYDVWDKAEACNKDKTHYTSDPCDIFSELFGNNKK